MLVYINIKYINIKQEEYRIQRRNKTSFAFLAFTIVLRGHAVQRGQDTVRGFQKLHILIEGAKNYTHKE